MKFYKLHESVYGASKQNTIEKVEYFWHYWDFLFTQKTNLILLDEPKFISHISLLNKIEKHLEWNKGISAKKLMKYFNHHAYFNQGNLIIRCDSKLKKHVSLLKKHIENCKANNEKSEHLEEIDREYLSNSFSVLRQTHFIVEEYTIILIDRLDKIVFNNSELNQTNRKDLKFLCNSIVDMFILRGYSIAFIKGLLSNAIFNRSNKFEFRYEKNYGDFNSNYSEWKKYVEEQYGLLTLKDRINYLRTYFKQPKKNGFYIFKIEGIDYQSKPVMIFNSKFYNPQIDSFVTFFKSDNKFENKRRDEYCRKCELFIIVDEDKSNTSKCNMIVPIEYNMEDLKHFDSFKFPAKSYIEAKNRATVSLLQFKREIKSYSIEHYWDENLANVRVSNESILVDKNFNYHSASNTSNSTKTIFKLDELRDKMFDEQLNYKADIKTQNSFILQLANSNALISSYHLEYHKLNYKSLWIECVEPFFGDKNDLLTYAKKCILIRTNFFSNYWILLHHALRKDILSYTYCLDEDLLKKLGLQNLNLGEYITGKELHENFEHLPDDSLLIEFKNEMRLFKLEQAEFISKIDSWITNTIMKAYDERNIEVHYNIIDYYNDVSIKIDMLFILSTVINSFNDAVFGDNNSSLEASKAYIKRAYDIRKRQI